MAIMLRIRMRIQREIMKIFMMRNMMIVIMRHWMMTLFNEKYAEWVDHQDDYDNLQYDKNYYKSYNKN